MPVPDGSLSAEPSPLTYMRNINMLTQDIKKELFKLRDNPYRDFQSRLIPTIKPGSMIGVRTPALRTFAKRLYKQEDVCLFLKDLPHEYFDENQLHAFIISLIKDYDACIAEVKRFLPFVNNWATCDQLSPVCFKEHRDRLKEQIKPWLSSGHTYTVRFGISMLMKHFLDGDFDASYPGMVASIVSDEYYVNMMIAWYFATALAKQYDAILPYIENESLEMWTHNKTIQKAVESLRLRREQKEYLKSLKRKG